MDEFVKALILAYLHEKVLDIENRVNKIYALDNEEELIKRELKGPIKL